LKFKRLIDIISGDSYNQTQLIHTIKMASLDWQDFQAESKDFKDKIILVTGAADGIGSYAEPIILPVDLMDITPESATELAQAVYNDIGRLDGILHNAAELGSPSPLDQYDMDYWNSVMHTNLQAPYILTRALLPLLKQEHSTSLLFTSADVGRNAAPYWGAYSIAYAGLEAQMTIWAEELENVSNIKVNSIDPGAVRTSFRRRSHPGESQKSLPTPQSITLAYLKILSGQHQFHGAKLTV